ncbi:antitoxin Xre/MbcA/ParS toxin-binding domain-containing protein [Gimibacter soli]|uniref:DUF2384 domain-containing protein n=1 Tax=Gimibacter soli TaxID=3024400 RepID=A0AAE9XQH3_9PROT|nr:antitoxin Xre/MbcA/ParS toxin-binding domain-containing protein [Gimibacter soli]WCL54409.1 DUF2384 domain-containing protein [Gimibacter soli]
MLTKAINRIADLWSIKNSDLGAILGVSPASISQLRNGARELSPETKEFELAQYLARLFHSLDAMVGSDDRAAKSWLNTENRELQARPIDLLKTIRGLVACADYLDGYLGTN